MAHNLPVKPTRSQVWETPPSRKVASTSAVTATCANCSTRLPLIRTAVFRSSPLQCLGIGGESGAGDRAYHLEAGIISSISRCAQCPRKTQRRAERSLQATRGPGFAVSLYLIGALDSEFDTTKFHCGNPPLDAYIRRYASQDVRRNVTRVFVATAESDPRRLAGFFPQSAGSVSCSDLPESLANYSHAIMYPWP